MEHNSGIMDGGKALWSNRMDNWMDKEERPCMRGEDMGHD